MQDLGGILIGSAAALAGGAAGSGWTGAVIVANVAFDGLDYNRADRQLRRVLLVASNFQAILLGAGAVCALLGGAIVGFVVTLLAALGFLSNVWTLAPRKGARMTGMRENKKGKRVVAVGLTLFMTLLATVGAVLCAFGV